MDGYIVSRNSDIRSSEVRKGGDDSKTGRINKVSVDGEVVYVGTDGPTALARDYA